MINNILLTAALVFISMQVLYFSERTYSLYKELQTDEIRILWVILGNLVMIFDVLVTWIGYRLIIAVIAVDITF